MCISSIYKHDIKWGLNFKPSGSPVKGQALDEKTPRSCYWTLAPKQSGARYCAHEEKKSRKVPSGQTPFTYSQWQLSSDGQGVHSTGTWLCWLLPRDLIHECHSSWIKQAHGHILNGMSQPSNSAFCCKQYSHIHGPDTTSLLHCKNEVWLQSLVWKERNWTVFSLTSLLHLGCTPARLILLPAV